MMRQVIKLLSILAIILSILWFVYQPGFEPAITALVGTAGLLGASLGGSSISPVTREEQNRRRKAILYIDDDLVRTRFDMLEHSGFKVVPAENADEALRQVKKQKFDLILLDIMMPPPKFVSKRAVRDGYETGVFLANKIKESINRETPIIVVTANPLRDVEAELRRIGVVAYLRKPFLQHDLEEEIQKALV